MADFLSDLLTSGPFMPHGHCYLWLPELVWLHVVSDALIALAYYVMPGVLIYFVRKRHDLPFNWMFLMFGAFIIACGTTHLVGVWTLWFPTYWFAGGVKLATASISLATACLLLPLVPRALALPSPAALETVNRELQAQILERQRAEAELRRAHDELERRVEERTAALAALNASLHAEIAERRRVEEALRKSEERYRRVFEDDITGDYIATPEGTLLAANPAFARIFGVASHEQTLHATLASFYPTTEAYAAFLARLREAKRLENYEAELRRPDGTPVYVIENAIGTFDERGELLEIRGYIFDSSERKRAEERFRLAVESAPNAVVMVNHDGRIVLVNAQAERFFGYSREELLGQALEMLVPERFRLEHPTSRRGFFTTPQIRPMGAGRDLYGRRKDGSEFPVEIGLTPIETAEGTLVLSAIVDITERKRAEEALRSANALLEKIFANLDHAVFLVEANSRTIITCNPAVEQVFGYQVHEVVGRNTAFLYPNRELYDAARRELFEALNRRDVHHAERQMRRKDGSLFFAETSASALTDEAGRRTQILSVWRDITARKRAEAEIRRLNAELEQRVGERTAQLEAANRELETFCYSVSHDLRAPLRSIDGFSQALVEDYGDSLDAQAQDCLQRIRGATQRMAELIDALLRLSRVTRAELQRRPVDLSAMAEAITAELRHQDPARAVEFDIALGLTTHGDARLLRVVLENLLGNAWKFTGKKGHARIMFGRQTDANGAPVFFVRDNGAGFDMTYADKLFGAFQRLHRMSEFQGTGIGLATVQRIVLRHGGRVWAEAEVGQGATFFFTL